MEHASLNPGQSTLVNAQLSTKVKIVRVSCIRPPYGGCEILKARCFYPDKLLKKIQITLFTFYFIQFGWPYGLTETYDYVYIYVYVYILMSLTLSISISLSISMPIHPNVYDDIYDYVYVYSNNFLKSVLCKLLY